LFGAAAACAFRNSFSAARAPASSSSNLAARSTSTAYAFLAGPLIFFLPPITLVSLVHYRNGIGAGQSNARPLRQGWQPPGEVPSRSQRNSTRNLAVRDRRMKPNHWSTMGRALTVGWSLPPGPDSLARSWPTPRSPFT
jgi:hypothetical protein